jgi:transposase InsO family protein
VIKGLSRESGTNTIQIGLGAPWRIGIGKCFNSRLRDELFSTGIFTTLAEASLLCDVRTDYNHRRPQRALGTQSQAE